jgi:hypothetical protein
MTPLDVWYSRLGATAITERSPRRSSRPT